MSASKVERAVRAHPCVEEVSDERSLGDGVFAYTKHGFCNHSAKGGGKHSEEGCLHCVHEDSWTAVFNALRRDVKPCDADCTRCHPKSPGASNDPLKVSRDLARHHELMTRFESMGMKRVAASKLAMDIVNSRVDERTAHKSAATAAALYHTQQAQEHWTRSASMSCNTDINAAAARRHIKAQRAHLVAAQTFCAAALVPDRADLLDEAQRDAKWAQDRSALANK